MPAPKEHHDTGVHVGKIRVKFPGGGSATIQVSCSFCDRANDVHRFHVSGGGSGMSQAEFEAYRDAKLRADPANGGDIRTAKSLLEQAGAECLWA
jgi:hypothetical protein